MFSQPLSDTEILNGFREGNNTIIRHYFYDYCRVGYNIFNQQYHLSQKDNLDFMSLAHQYALYLIEHDWKPLENHSRNITLRTWLINGFRYVVLDALKWYRKEYGNLSFEDYLISFDMKDDLRKQFNCTVLEICNHEPLSRQDRLIIDLLLLQGFKTKEVAEQLGLTPSAISQKFKTLKEQVIFPYFKHNFDMDFDTPELMIDDTYSNNESTICGNTLYYDEQEMYTPLLPSMKYDNIEFSRCMQHKKRNTPEYISQLQANEIFVFGSNLKGLHGGGAAYTAYHNFGAIMGQGVGIQGQSYAIPTMQGGVNTIRPYVDNFIQFAKGNHNLTFLVTRIGCGIAGFSDEEIAPLFTKAHNIENIVLPKYW